MTISMTIKGGDKLAAQLKQMQRSLRNEKLRDALRPGAEIVLDDAQRRVPVLSGDLRDSLKIRERSSAVVELVSDQVYAPTIEFGWPGRGIAPQPFMRPALHENRDDVFEAIEHELQQEMGL